MPQSEDKIALDELTIEIKELEDFIDLIKKRLAIMEDNLSKLKYQKKQNENYLNSDNNGRG